MGLCQTQVQHQLRGHRRVLGTALAAEEPDVSPREVGERERQHREGEAYPRGLNPAECQDEGLCQILFLASCLPGSRETQVRELSGICLGWGGGDWD